MGRGLVAKVVNKVSASLKSPYEELLNLLASEERLNVDETGHKDNGRRWWTWCVDGELALGQFGGVAGRVAWCLVAGGEAVSRLHDPVTGTRTNTAKTRNRQVATGVAHDHRGARSSRRMIIEAHDHRGE